MTIIKKIDLAKLLGIKPPFLNYLIGTGRIPAPSHYRPGYVKPHYTQEEADDIIKRETTKGK